jgi:hypothetical protein
MRRFRFTARLSALVSAVPAQAALPAAPTDRPARNTTGQSRDRHAVKATCATCL